MTNIRQTCLTCARFSISGPTMKPGVSHNDKIGSPWALQICIKRATLSAPSASIAPAMCMELLAMTPNGRPSMRRNPVTMLGPNFGLISRNESVSAIALITVRTL